MSEQTTQYWVTPYNVERCYGGPEEGGWWFDAGEPMVELSLGPFDNIDDARRMQDALRPWQDEQNEGRRPLHSVLSDGAVWVCVEEHEPRPFPEETPRYE